MAEVFKERIPCSNGTDVECNVLELKVVYDLGGYNMATYEPKPRGYYLHCSPLQVGGGWVKFQGFSGTYMLLNEVTRQSKKGEAEAMRLYAENRQKVIDYVCGKHGIALLACDTLISEE